MIRKKFSRQLARLTERSTRRFRRTFEKLEDRRLLALRTWTGQGLDDLWTNVDNWAGGLPGNGDDVVIPSVQGSEVVRFDAAGVTSLNSLTSDEPFWFAGHDLALNGPGTFSFNSTLRMSSGALVGSGTVDVLGHITWSAGAMGGTGITNAQAGMTLNGLFGSPVIRDTRTVNNFADATFEAAPSLAVPQWFISCSTGAVFNNLASGSFTIVGTSDFQGGTLNNQGRFIKTAGAIGDGVTHFNAAVFNQTSTTPVDVQGGTLQLGGGGTHSGDFDFTGATLELGPLATTGSNNFNAGANLTGTTFRVSAGIHNFNVGSSYNVSGASSFVSGTSTFNGTVLSIGDTVAINAGDVTFNQNISTGALTLLRGTLRGSGSVNVSGLTTWSGGDMRGSGVTNANGGLVLSTVNGSLGLRDTRTINNAAEATFNGNGGPVGFLSLDTGAVFNNLATGSFTIEGTNDFLNSNLVFGTFNNHGTFTKRSGSGGDGVTRLAVRYSNSGLLDIQSGTLLLDGPFANFNTTTGTLSGGTYLVSGVWRFLNANIVTNDATLTLRSPASQIVNQNTGGNGIAGFINNTATASFALQNRNLSTTAAGSLFTNAGSMTFDASTFSVAGGGQYRQAGGTTTLVNGGLTASNTEIAGGTLRGNGNVIGNLQNTGGTVAPGLPTVGIITVTGNYSQTSGGALAVDIAGRAPAGGGSAGVDFDQLSVAGSVTLSGAVNFAVIGEYVPVAGDDYPIIPGAAGVAGTFSGVLGTQINSEGLFFDPEYRATSFDVIVTHLDAGADRNVNEGPIGVNARFTDLGADDNYTGTIDWGDGSPVGGLTFLPGNLVAGSHLYDNGTFEVTVRLLGDDGSEATDVLVVTVTNVSPTVGAFSVFSDEGLNFRLSADVARDPAGVLDPLTATWDLDGDGVLGETGPNAGRGDEVGRAPTFDAAALDGPVTVMITLRVDDGDGGIAERDAEINIVNVEPTADAGGPYDVGEGGSVALLGTGTDVAGDNDPLTFNWDLDSDGIFGETGPSATHGNEVGANATFDAASLGGPATVAVTLRVDDGDGGITEDTATIGVRSNALPNTGDSNTSIFNLPDDGVDNLAILEDDGDPNNGMVRLRSGNGTFSTTTFVNPISATWINASDDGETVTIARLDSAYGARAEVFGNTGNDSFRLDFSAGVNIIPQSLPSPHATFNGGGGADAIILVDGYSATNIDYTFEDEGAGVSPLDGLINIDGGVVRFRDLDQARGVFDPLTATNRSFNFAASTAADTITVGDDPAGPNRLSRITSDSSPTLDFADPNNMLTVSAGDGGDLITFRAIDAAGLSPATIVINGNAGNDDLTVDYAFGNPSPAAGSLTFDAGPETSTPGDRLLVVNVNANTPALTLLPDDTDGHRGQINFDGSQINYEELGLVSISSAVANTLINLPTGDGDNQAILESPNAGQTRIRSGNNTFATIDFATPTISLTVSIGNDSETVNGGPGNETFQLDFSSGGKVITLNGGGGSDSVVLVPGYIATSIDYTFEDEGTGTTPFDGLINIDGGVVRFRDLNQARGIVDSLAATNHSFAFGASTGADTITIGDDPAGPNGLSRLTSDSSPNLNFADPGDMLSVSAGAGGDLITLRALEAANANPTTIVIDGDGGDDTMTVDFAFGSVTAVGGSLTFDGGPEASPPGDRLFVVNVNANTATLSLLPNDANGHRGQLNFDGSPINYQDQELVSVSGTVAGIVINLPMGDGDNQAIVEDSPNPGQTRIRSGNNTFATIDFPTPTNSLAVNDDGETISAATWTGASALGSSWSDPANWAGNRAPSAGAELIFPATAGRLISINDLPVDTQFASITFDGSGYELQGNRLIVGADGFTVTGGTHSVALDVGFDSNAIGVTFDSALGAALIINGVISGEADVVKRGAGTLILAGANIYSGETEVLEGVLNLRHSMALGSSAGQTILRGGTTLVLQNNITIQDDLTLVGDPPGTEFPGVTVVSRGNNSIGNEAEPAEARRIALNPFLTVTVADGTLTINSVMSGEDDMAKDGPGTLILNADNTLTGTISLLQGTLLVNGSQPNTPIVVEGGSLGGIGLMGPITVNGGQIQDALMQSSPIEPGRTDLVVGGTAAGDSILFVPSWGSSTVNVWLNGVLQGTFSPTGRLVAYGLAGNDAISIVGITSRSAWFDGGDGHDFLSASFGNDVLLGDGGNDLIFGIGGRDLMIGGAGADWLFGNSDDDILVAGNTAYDSDTQALAKIMAEWTSSRTYTARTSNLRGEGLGPRLNGEIFLDGGGAGATVFDDGEEDKLTGGSSRDWFFANLVGGVRDRLFDRQSSELVDELGA